MGNMQILLIVMALVLLSTITITIFNANDIQTEQAYLDMYRNQSMRVADYFMQKVETEYITGVTTFDQMAAMYTSKDTTFVIDNHSYRVRIRALRCNENGNTAAPTNNYRKVDISVSMQFGDRPVVAGTTASPISIIIARNGF